MDGTETKQDVETSADNQGTSTSTPQTFTQEQVAKAISDALSNAGRDAKTFDTRKIDLDRRETSIKEAEAKWQKEQEDRDLAELEAVKDNPEELTLVQRKQKLANDIRTHNAEKAQFQGIIDACKELGINDAEDFKKVITESRSTKFVQTVSDVANKYNVDTEVLKTTAKELGLTDSAAIEKLASSLPKKNAVPAPDSGKTLGGTNISGLSPEAKIRYGMEHPEAKMN